MVDFKYMCNIYYLSPIQVNVMSHTEFHTTKLLMMN